MPQDPFRYFRVEARELLEGLAEGVRALEGAPADPAPLPKLLRLAHTLKGAARVVKRPEMAQVADALETVFVRLRDERGSLTGEEASTLWRLIHQGSAQVEALGPAPTPAPAPTASRPTAEEARPRLVAPSGETVRVALPELDALLHAVLALGTQMEGLWTQVAEVGRLAEGERRLGEAVTSGVHAASARMLAEALEADAGALRRDLERGVERTASAFNEVRALAQGLRLVPARTVFPALELAARDAAAALGKAVTFEGQGGEVRLDVDVLLSLRDALSHVARNAVAHGLEPSADRAARGKPATGTVRLRVERRDRQVAFLCEDDGRGIDVEAVRREAVSRGKLGEAEARALSAKEVMGLLLNGGLSTAPRVTELSGRGVGLDVARATAARLRGTVRLSSELGRGTTVELCVPISIASWVGLELEAGATRAALPLESVRHTRRIRDEELDRGSGRAMLLHEGKAVPFIPLERALRASSGGPREVWTAVLVRNGAREAAIGVDRLGDTAERVVRTLPALVAAEPVVAGTWLDAAGHPRLMLDPAALIDAAEADDGASWVEPPGRPAPVLVVDDSLTSRILEKTLLESAGYEVELAVSAEEALVRARRARHSLFLVDVEMPGMDGFGFLEVLREDPVLRTVPAILITSRDAPADRARGLSLGAKAYVAKGELDQKALLETIRGLIG